MIEEELLIPALISLYLIGFTFAFSKLAYKHEPYILTSPLFLYKIIIISLGSWITFIYEILKEQNEKT